MRVGGLQGGSQKGSLNPVHMILLSVAFKPEIVHVICIVLLSSVLVYLVLNITVVLSRFGIFVLNILLF